jgi:TetR/AcrR family transcriptional regulator, regulator of autoinduction and epiphytic fitness
VLHNECMSADAVFADPRQARTRAAVHRAALEVLRREGIGGTTMDAIASEASVARSTLYRNWENRNQILAAAIDAAAAVPPFVEQGSAIEQLDTLVVGLAASLQRSEWGRALPAIVGAIAAEPELSEHYDRFTESRRATAIQIVRHGIRNRELPAGLPVEEFIDALVGPFFYRRLVRNVTTSPTWARRHLARTLQSFS